MAQPSQGSQALLGSNEVDHVVNCAHPQAQEVSRTKKWSCTLGMINIASSEAPGNICQNSVRKEVYPYRQAQTLSVIFQIFYEYGFETNTSEINLVFMLKI